MGGLAYFAYNYVDDTLDYLIKNNVFSVVDISAWKTVREDAFMKLKTLTKDPGQLKNLNHFSNNMFTD